MAEIFVDAPSTEDHEAALARIAAIEATDGGHEARMDALEARIAALEAVPPPPPTPSPPPSTGRGFTDLSTLPKAKVFYVSPTGDDSNDGESEGSPFRTLQRAYNSVRSGSPDWILLQGGGAYQGPLASKWEKSGQDANARIVVASYGQESAPRPIIDPGAAMGCFFAVQDGGFVSLYSLDFYNRARDPSSPGYDPAATGSDGIRFYAGPHDIRLEDVRVRFFSTGISGEIDRHTGNAPRNIEIFRCTVDHNYPRGSHGQGLFFTGVTGITIDECVIDYNGWNAESGAARTIFNHNAYINGCHDVVVRDCWSTRGSSMSWKLKANTPRAAIGGLYTGNVCSESAIGFSMGGNIEASDIGFEDQRCNDNVFVDMWGNPPAQPEKRGLGIKSIRNSEFLRNLFLHSPTDYGNKSAIWVLDMPIESTRVADNLAYAWQTNGPVYRIDAPAGVDAQGNVEVTDPSQVVYAQRTMKTFAASVGAGPDLASLMAVAVENRKGAWNSDVTAKAASVYFREGFKLVN